MRKLITKILKDPIILRAKEFVFQLPLFSLLGRVIWRDKRHHLIGRNWNLDYNIVPSQFKRAFIRSALSGTPDLNLRIEGIKVNAILCAQPKSASLYLTQLLSLCLGLRNYQIGFDNKGGEIYYPRLLAAKFAKNQIGTISHCHAAPTPTVLKMIDYLNFRPLILTRNLVDTIVSRKDMLIKDKFAGNILSSDAMRKFIHGSLEYQIDVIIDLFANEYINFYSGWDAHRGNTRLRPIYITYKEMLEDEVSLISRVADELNLSVTPAEIKRNSIDIKNAGGINFNKGVSGRGAQVISKKQIEILRMKAQMFGCKDPKFLGFEI